MGDSLEQNGSWKIALAKAKRELVRYKRRMAFDMSILRTDVMPLVNEAWKNNFAQVESN